MSDWREQNQLSQRLFEHTKGVLDSTIIRGCQDWPLPEPPLSDPDFPVHPPTSPDKLKEIAHALLEANRAAFDRDLESIGESLIPHRLSLSADPAREGRKWLDRRGDEVAERALFIRVETLLSQALDPTAPDVDRWWVAIALLNGMSSKDSPISQQQGYHLMESIALAKPPGYWHGGAEPGPHLLDWQEGRESTTVELQADSGGSFAAGWLLDRMEEADPPRPVLVEWLDIALARRTLVAPLEILSRLNRMAGDGSSELAIRIASLLPRAWDIDFEGAHLLEKTLLGREANVRCGLAGALDEIIRRRGESTLPLVDALLSDESTDVVRIATGSLRLTATLDSTDFANRCARVVHKGDVGISRQFSQTTLREYLAMHPEDKKGLTVQLWIEGDEVVRSRLRELLLHMVDEHATDLSSILMRIASMDGHNSLEDLWRVLEVRSADTAFAWRNHIEHGAELP
ncbi:MAG: hypothetical protein QF454_01430 [Candidatus Thalassarchaeaceae archaeon]|nr:hypothetical protein [Candidatus Thalassarchaeaceae archaeon]